MVEVEFEVDLHLAILEHQVQGSVPPVAVHWCLVPRGGLELLQGGLGLEGPHGQGSQGLPLPPPLLPPTVPGLTVLVGGR